MKPGNNSLNLNKKNGSAKSDQKFYYICSTIQLDEIESM